MVVFMWAMALYVGFVYTILTISSIVSAESGIDIVVGIFLIFPPAILAILMMASRMIG